MKNGKLSGKFPSKQRMLQTQDITNETLIPSQTIIKSTRRFVRKLNIYKRIMFSSNHGNNLNSDSDFGGLMMFGLGIQ